MYLVLAKESGAGYRDGMLGDHPIRYDPTMVISALGLLVVFERQLIAVIRAAIAVLGLFKLLVKRVTATIRAGRVLLTELRLKKSQQSYA
jgi:hypothetical protein